MKYTENMFGSNITNEVIGLNNKIKSNKKNSIWIFEFQSFKKSILIQAEIISINA